MCVYRMLKEGKGREGKGRVEGLRKVCCRIPIIAKILSFSAGVEV